MIELTEEGLSSSEKGSPEYQFVSNIKLDEKVDLKEMEQRIGQQVAKIGFGKAMKQKWIKKEEDLFIRIVENPVDEDKTNL